MDILTRIPKDRFIEYKNLKIQSVVEEPLAFSSTKEDLLKRTDEQWKKDISDPNKVSVFAEENGELVGIGTAQCYIKDRFKHLATLYNLYVHNGFRGKGIATHLMQKREEILKERGVTQVICDVYGTQTASLKIHEKLGYKEVGRIPNFSCTNGACTDKVILYKEL